MIIPKVKNLIKDDFSDFVAPQGAVVTRNKTFPIDVFKGGRNLLLDSEVVDVPLGTPFKRYVMRLEAGHYTVSFDNFELLEGTPPTRIFMKARRINEADEVHLIYFDYPITNKIATFEVTGYVDYFEVFSSSSTANSNLTSGVYSYLKLEKGNIATEWSPAPEDGYGLDLPNGAYHIQTSGGTNSIKLYRDVFGLEYLEKVNESMKIKNFGKGMVSRLNRTNAQSVSIATNELIEINRTGEITVEATPIPQAHFRAIAIEDNLDFIASNPSIIDEQSLNTKNVLDIVQLPEISREEKQITILSNDEVIIDDFISFKMSTKGSIYQRNMKYCEIVLNGKHELTSEWLNVKRFIASDIVDDGNFQEIDYGDFGVLKTEYDDTTQRTKLTCYDRMLQAQIPYDSEVMDLTYPMTVSQVLNRLAIVCKLDLVVNTVNNLYQVIAVDLWANQSFTYADVLDHIAQATTSIISIRDNKLEIFNPIENDFTIQGKFTSLKMGETFGKTNIVNVSQEPQHYNKFAPINALDIPLEDRKELAFSNNPILNQDMQTWADRLYLQTKDLEYATFESSTIGYGVFEIGDMVNVYEANEDIMHRVMITNETFDFKHALVTEIGSALPMVHKNQYVVETDQIRQGQTTYLIVDQLNGIIEALVQKVDDESDKTAQLRIDVDSIASTVENISLGNLLSNGSGEMGFAGWIGGSTARYVTPLIRYIDGLTYSMGFIPQTNPLALSETELSFYSDGFDVSPMAFIVPDMEHSYRAKIMRFKPFNIDVLEFNSLDNANNMVVGKTTKFTFNTSVAFAEFTFTPSASTQYVRFKYNRTGVSPTDRLNIAEVMFNRGQPKEWQLSPLNAIVYSQTTRVQLADRITDAVEKIEVVDGKTVSNKSMIDQQAHAITLKANQIALDALEVIVNGKVTFNDLTTAGNTIINGENITTGTISANRINFNGAKGTNMDITGKVTATSGKIAGFDINGNNLIGTDIGLRPNEVSIGSTTMYKSSADAYELVIKGGGISVQPESGYVAIIKLGSHLFAQEFSGLGVVMNTVHRMLPISTEGTSAIGGSTRRYENIYLINQPNVSSDARFKFNITDIDPFLLDMIAEYVIPKTYETQFDDKSHFGYIAQDVEMAFYQYFYQSSINNGMDKLEASRFANDEIKMFALLSKDESYMSLLYGEIAVLIDAYNRMKNNELEDRISKLERLINDENKD